MRSVIGCSLFALSLCAACRAQIAPLRWDVQLDRPVPHDTYVWQGETVDLMPRLVVGTRPVAVTDAVEFRYREPDLAAGLYRHVPAAADPATGVISVRWTPELDTGAAHYDYQFIVGTNAQNPRAFGRIAMRPTIGHLASTNPPPAVSQYALAADLQALSNALAGAVQQVAGDINAAVAAGTAGLATSQQVDAH
ncbi:MAG TPA: hypothetical protein PLY53_15730, partial [Planctomycetota bacterium]|nr:hypothetical protein [Planctomycetota bacterium]